MNEISLKILLVGETSVGKTSLFLRYIDNFFPDKHMASVGVEYRIKLYEYRKFKINLQVWDTAGQERFHAITNNYFHNSDGILFVFDMTEPKSYEYIKKWIEESEQIENNFEKLLIGNKCDLIHKKKVSEEEINKYCNENNIEWLEVSAKENINVKETFNKIVELIFKDKTDEDIKELYRSRLNNSSNLTYKIKKKKKKVCC